MASSGARLRLGRRQHQPVQTVQICNLGLKSTLERTQGKEHIVNTATVAGAYFTTSNFQLISELASPDLQELPETASGSEALGLGLWKEVWYFGTLHQIIASHES